MYSGDGGQATLVPASGTWGASGGRPMAAPTGTGRGGKAFPLRGRWTPASHGSRRTDEVVYRTLLRLKKALLVGGPPHPSPVCALVTPSPQGEGLGGRGGQAMLVPANGAAECLGGEEWIRVRLSCAFFCGEGAFSPFWRSRPRSSPRGRSCCRRPGGRP